jgi:hypothetical protein
MARSSKPEDDAAVQDAPEGAQGASQPAEAPVEGKPAPAATEPSDATADPSTEAEPVGEHPHAFARELMPIVPAVRKENPRKFARVVNGVVMEIITEVQNIEEEWRPDILKTFQEITDLPEGEAPSPGWTTRGKGFKKPEPEELTTAQERRIAMEVEGVTIGKSKVKLTNEVWQRLGQVAQHAALFRELPGGDVTLPGDPPLVFKKADDFLATYKALSVWRERWNQHVDGTLKTAPSSDLTV